MRLHMLHGQVTDTTLVDSEDMRGETPRDGVSAEVSHLGKTLCEIVSAKMGNTCLRSRPGDVPWSNTVEDYYPVDARSRWTSSSAPVPQLLRALDAERGAYHNFLEAVTQFVPLLRQVPHEMQLNSPNMPFWKNTWFSALDAAALMTTLAWKAPKAYIEIGSGNSTCFANFVRKQAGLATTITSIDPHPRRDIHLICDTQIRSGLETCDLAIFDSIEPGDIVFFDGSHRVFSNSDTTVFFFEVLPRLKPGVFVHIHDIFLPDDYPSEWDRRLYNEQYVVAAMLLCRERPFSLVAPVWFMCRDPDLSKRVRNIFKSPGGDDIPFTYPAPNGRPGSSFWIQT